MTQPTAVHTRYCTAPGCDRPRRYIDYCDAHRARMRKYGSLDLPPRRKPHPCSIDGCGSPGDAGRGYCNKHYKRLLIHGDPLHVEPPRGPDPVPVEERFWRYVTPRGADECWEWVGARNRQGYGMLKRKDGKQLRANRVSYEMHHGPVPEGLMVCHRCDNPPCCNPAHLYAGTAYDNARDRWRGRSGSTNDD